MMRRDKCEYLDHGRLEEFEKQLKGIFETHGFEFYDSKVRYSGANVALMVKDSGIGDSYFSRVERFSDELYGLLGRKGLYSVDAVVGLNPDKHQNFATIAHLIAVSKVQQNKLADANLSGPDSPSVDRAFVSEFFELPRLHHPICVFLEAFRVGNFASVKAFLELGVDPFNLEIPSKMPEDKAVSVLRFMFNVESSRSANEAIQLRKMINFMLRHESSASIRDRLDAIFDALADRHASLGFLSIREALHDDPALALSGGSGGGGGESGGSVYDSRATCL